VEIIAHRGASHDAPENTLAAIELGWAQKADAVEVDIQGSRDGQLVVIHDPTTTKTCGRRRSVAGQTLEELRQLDAGRWKGRAWAGQTIPTLAEAIDTIPDGRRLFVEIKCGAETVPEFARVVSRSGKAPGQVTPIGFDWEMMRRVKQALPRNEVCWVTAFRRHWRGHWTPDPAAWVARAKAGGLDGLDLGAQGPVTEALIEQLHQAALKVYVWTVDQPAQGRKLRDAGLDGLTTNRPGWMREQLAPG
jgi:glycerophosphoryl diester phosphodiesterase